LASTFLRPTFALLIFSVLFPWFQSSSASLSDALAVEIGSNAGISFGSIRLWGKAWIGTTYVIAAIIEVPMSGYQLS
jgi:hypothetical protein